MSEKETNKKQKPDTQYFHPLVVTSTDENLPAVSNPALHRYLQEISQYELLSREETEELAVRFREDGDAEAAYRLVSSNLYILKFIMDNWRLVKIGTTQAQRKLFFSLNKEKKLLEAQGFKPDVKLLAERLNVKESEVIEMGQRMDGWDVSLEAPVRNDSEDDQKSFLPHNGPGIEDIVAGHEVRERISGILTGIDDKLNDKEKVILSSRLLNDEPVTLQTIADQFSISRERVRQIEANLLKKLKAVFEKEVPDIKDFITSDRIVPATGPDRA
jgi:RNA polymerase sigma-32 factor